MEDANAQCAALLAAQDDLGGVIERIDGAGENAQSDALDDVRFDANDHIEKIPLEILKLKIRKNHELGELMKRESLHHFRLAGEDLLKAKAVIPHKKFGRWLEDAFGGNPKARTLQIYMQIAENWDHEAVVAVRDQGIEIETQTQFLKIVRESKEEPDSETKELNRVEARRAEMKGMKREIMKRIGKELDTYLYPHYYTHLKALHWDICEGREYNIYPDVEGDGPFYMDGEDECWSAFSDALNRVTDFYLRMTDPEYDLRRVKEDIEWFRTEIAPEMQHSSGFKRLKTDPEAPMSEEDERREREKWHRLCQKAQPALERSMRRRKEARAKVTI